MTLESGRDLPREVSHLLEAWVWRRRAFISLHIGIGIVGLLAATGAASGLFQTWTPYLSFITMVSIAVLAFAEPRREYSKYAKAVRVLYIATLRYRYSEQSLDQLLAAVERGEALIEADEQDQAPSALQLQEAIGGNRPKP